MKKRFTFLIAVLLLTASHLGWAQTKTEVTDVLNNALIGITGNNYTSWSDVTSNSDAVYAGQSAGNFESIQLRSKNNNSGIVTTASGGNATKVTVVWNSNTYAGRILQVYGKSSAFTSPTELYNSSTQGTLIGEINIDTDTTLLIEDTYSFIGLRSKDGAIYLTEIDITWNPSDNPTPSFTIGDQDMLAYNATSGSFSFTVNNAVTGGSVSVTEEEDWISNATVSGSTVNFTTTVNPTGAARSGVITLTYTYSGGTVTKNVTITQAGNPDAVNNISDITANGTYAVQGTIVAISSRGLIVGDGTGYVYYFYGDGFTTTHSIGDIVKLSGSVTTYGGVFEFTKTTSITDATQSNYVVESPTVITGTEMDARVASTSPAQLSSYVQYEGTLSISGNYYNITDIEGASTAIGSISYPSNGTELAAMNGQQVTVSGYFVGISSSKYYNTLIGSVVPVESPTPVIHVNNTTINLPYDATSGQISYAINNPVAGTALNATTDASWISNIQVANDTTVTFATTVNNGTADRSATITLSYTGATSKTVTVKQGHYVNEFADLPFEFDGGRDSIANTPGLTHEGIDSDYAGSPHLKFNTTGDWLLLKFNGRPGILTFDIKGNTFSEGTFTVQTSEDGTTFNDLATYTELGATQSESFNDLGANVRYIKWIYTNKVNGNVALGNIKLEAYEAPQYYRLSIANPAHVTINASYDGGTLTNGGSANVLRGASVSLSVVVAEGYVLDSIVATNQANEHVALTQSNDSYTFVMPSSNVNVTAYASVAPVIITTNYNLATEVVSGRHYIITNGDDKAMGKQNNNNRAGADITTNNGVAAVGSESGVYEFVINGPDVDGFYTIYDANENSTGYLYAAGANSSNHLRTETFCDNRGQWTITFDEDTHAATIKANCEGRNWMRYNSSSALFSCYSETSSQQDIYLYVKDVEDTYEFYTDVKGYGESDSLWKIIASPIASAVNPTTVNRMVDSVYDLYAYEQIQGQEWRNYKTTTYNLVSGKGYLYANKHDITLHFEGQPKTSGNVSLTYNANTNHNGWNLIGNPFGQAAYITGGRSFYVMNEEGKEVIAAEGNGVNPMQGVFVVAANANDNSVTFSTSTRKGYKSVVINLNQGKTLTDRAIIRFDEAINLDKYVLHENSTKIFFTQENKDYAVVRAESQGETTFNVKAKAPATYTINVKVNQMEFETLQLIDNLTGAEIDLLKTPSYTFSTENSIANRFKIIYFEKNEKKGLYVIKNY